MDSRKRRTKTTKITRSGPQRDFKPECLGRNTESDDRQEIGEIQKGENTKPGRVRRTIPDSKLKGLEGAAKREMENTSIFAKSCERWEGWEIEPDVGRVANGVSNRVDRLKCLGNAVVPQVVTYVGTMIEQMIENGGEND